MNITLISLYSDVSSIGIRILSSCLKNEAYNCKMVFIPHLTESQYDFRDLDSDEVLSQLADLCANDGLVGISVMTNYFERAVHITKYLKEKTKATVLWGGVHPTTCPDESVEYADFIIIGEGEEAIVELANAIKNKSDFPQIQNLAFKKDGAIIKNPLRPLIQDLDSIPFPDYDLNSSYVAIGGKLQPMTAELYKYCLLHTVRIFDDVPAYQIITSRGCPLNCSYCCNDIFRRLYKGQKYLRIRSVDNIIQEIQAIKGLFDFIGTVWISDDSFIERTLDQIKEFRDKYKWQIRVPFFCLGDPLNITDEKLDVLCDAGLEWMTMGIQTGSQKIKKLYTRSIKNEKILEAAKIINNHKDCLKPPMYDFIVDNPYEDYNDHYETMALINQLPLPFKLQVFSLTLYPGTSLLAKCIEDKHIQDPLNQVYRKSYFYDDVTYYILLMLFHNHGLPRPILKILSSKPMFFLFDRPLFTKALTGLIKMAKRIVKGNK